MEAARAGGRFDLITFFPFTLDHREAMKITQALCKDSLLKSRLHWNGRHSIKSVLGE